jgi:hypothetical protein
VGFRETMFLAQEKYGPPFNGPARPMDPKFAVIGPLLSTNLFLFGTCFFLSVF